MSRQSDEVSRALMTVRAVLQDAWPPPTWVEQIEHELERAKSMLGRDWTLDSPGYGPRAAYRAQLIKIAALATRAIEQLDGDPR